MEACGLSLKDGQFFLCAHFPPEVWFLLLWLPSLGEPLWFVSLQNPPPPSSSRSDARPFVRRRLAGVFCAAGNSHLSSPLSSLLKRCDLFFAPGKKLDPPSNPSSTISIIFRKPFSSLLFLCGEAANILRISSFGSFTRTAWWSADLLSSLKCMIYFSVVSFYFCKISTL